MLDLIRKNRKKILAVAGVFLMIAFIVPNVSSPGRGRDGSVGFIGKEEIPLIEYQYATVERELLSSQLFIPIQTRDDEGRPTTGQVDVLTYALVAVTNDVSVAQAVARRLDVMSYLLLLREARQMGVQPDPQEVEELLKVLQGKGRRHELARDAVRNWLTILKAFEQVSATTKMTPAEAVQLAAMQQQRISVRLVDFPAEQFKPAVPEPTTEQLQELFTKHREENPEANEQGLGYRYPNRVKIQYMQIPLDEVKKTISEEDIYDFYRKNMEQFRVEPTTQPATQPTTQPADAAAATEANATTQPSTQPTYRTWREAADEIRNTLARQRTHQMARQLHQAFQADWSGYQQALRDAGGSAAQKPPGTSATTAYTDYLYIRRLNERLPSRELREVAVQTRPETDELLSARNLRDLPGIGKSFSMEYRVGFAEFATLLVDPLLTDAERREYSESNVPVLALYQPGPVLIDEQGNQYLFRVVEADRARAPASLDEVRDRVQRDYIALRAYEKAKEEADKFLAVAKEKGLDAAAAERELVVVETERFSNIAGQKLEKFKLPDEAYGQFIQGAFALLHERLRTGHEHPLAVIEVPRGRVVTVARLEEAEPAPDGFVQQIASMHLGPFGRQMRLQQVRQDMARGWFSRDAVSVRVNYIPPKATQQEQPEAPQPEPRRPII